MMCLGCGSCEWIEVTSPVTSPEEVTSRYMYNTCNKEIRIVPLVRKRVFLNMMESKAFVTMTLDTDPKLPRSIMDFFNELDTK